jgi:hypothetical protein
MKIAAFLLLAPLCVCAQVPGEVFEFRGRPGDPQPRYEVRHVSDVQGQAIAWLSITGVVVNAGGGAGRCVLTGLTLPFSVEALKRMPSRRVAVQPVRPLAPELIQAWQLSLQDGDAKALSRTAIAQALTRIEGMDRLAFERLFGFDPYRGCPQEGLDRPRKAS